MDALREEVVALLRLDATPTLGLRSLIRLVEEFGSGREALVAPGKLFAAIAGRDALAQRADAAVHAAVERGLRDADRLGMRVCSWSDPVYPEAFHHLADPPPVVFLRGDASLLAKPGVTIVGARRATQRGRDVARRLGAALGRAGVPVVSGMALGVDAQAHAGALEARGDTIAVLGRGADRAYPRSNGRLFRAIVERGLAVSEFLPGTPALPHHFPRRNRLIAALSHTVVVVEAARRSGSLITVEHALDLGLDVYAVPGPIDLAACGGSNALLRDGATPLTSIDDFVATVSGSVVEAAGKPPVGLDDRLCSVYRALADGERHVDELAAKLGLDLSELLRALTDLEVAGWVEQRPGQRFRRAA